MNNLDRAIDPAQAFQALQQYIANEASRFYAEIAMRDAYIKQLEEQVQELEKKLDG